MASSLPYPSYSQLPPPPPPQKLYSQYPIPSNQNPDPFYYGNNGSPNNNGNNNGQLRSNRPKVTTTIWEDEGTICFQVESDGIVVARREDNDYINGTKLLNVAKMSRGKRDGILKSERDRRVIKIGAMHLKGVWIPFSRALFFAARERIQDSLWPLFDADIKRFLYHPMNIDRTNALAVVARQRQQMLNNGNGHIEEGSPQHALHPQNHIQAQAQAQAHVQPQAQPQSHTQAYYNEYEYDRPEYHGNRHLSSPVIRNPLQHQRSPSTNNIAYKSSPNTWFHPNHQLQPIQHQHEPYSIDNNHQSHHQSHHQRSMSDSVHLRQPMSTSTEYDHTAHQQGHSHPPPPLLHHPPSSLQSHHEMIRPLHAPMPYYDYHHTSQQSQQHPHHQIPPTITKREASSPKSYEAAVEQTILPTGYIDNPSVGGSKVPPANEWTPSLTRSSSVNTHSSSKSSFMRYKSYSNDSYGTRFSYSAYPPEGVDWYNHENGPQPTSSHYSSRSFSVKPRRSQVIQHEEIFPQPIVEQSIVQASDEPECTTPRSSRRSSTVNTSWKN